MNTTMQQKKEWPKLTLYGDLNMRPFRNIWMLEEIGLPYGHVVCKPWSKVAKSVHPLGKVPALMVEYSDSTVQEKESSDGKKDSAENKFVVLESAAINTFLGDLAREISITDTTTATQQQQNLVPPPATSQRAKYDSLAMFVMTELDSQSLWIHRKHFDLPNVFGEAPTAVKEARRQFDNALDAMVEQITENENHDNDDKQRYLLSAGFSAIDLIFANCCFWAQQIGWLDRNSDTTNYNASSSEKENDDNNETKRPHPLTPKLAAYLKQCRSRPAFMRANELRKNQVYEKKENPISKL